jgi:polysaccharide biosynthesis transport protein
MLSSAYDTQAQFVLDREDKAVRYTMIKHDVDTQRRLYEALLQKGEEAGLAAAMRASTIRIVDPATPSRAPYFPKQTLFTGVGSLLGLTFAMVIAIFQSRFDEKLRDPGEVSDSLRLRELGVIPSTPAHATTALLERARSRPSELPAFKVTERKQLSRYREGFVLSEAFSGTMNSLIISSGGEVPKVLVVSSPGSREGKTTVAVNLAIALANIGRRIVLVDGDMRSPRLHRIFNLPQAGGLSDLLSNCEPLEEMSAKSMARATDVDNLYVIPTGEVLGDIGPLLHSDRMSRLLQQLQDSFDTVIFDSPPFLFLSDARVLGWLAGGVLLVFRSGQTTKEAAFAAQHLLRQDGIRVVGTVLNDWKVGKQAKYEAYLPTAEKLPPRKWA